MLRLQTILSHWSWVSLLLLGSAPALPARQAGQPLVPIPSAAELLARLHKGHPRLLASSNDFAQLTRRIAAEPALESWRTKLRQRAQEIIAAAPSRYEIPDGLRLLDTSRRVVNRVYVLGLLHRLEGKPAYAERAWQELDAAAHFPDWNPRHFLDTAEMTHAFAVAYDWLYDSWTPEQRALLSQAMVEKGLRPALGLYRAGGWWTQARHNWNQVCNGGIGMGALALAEVEPELAGEILEAALKSLELAMAEFAPDGAWKEGPGYWNYATSYNVVFLAALQTALGADFGLSQINGFGQTGFFPIYLTGPLGRTFNYADGGDQVIRAPQMFWLARRFNQPAYAWFERQVAAPAALDLLWRDSESAGPASAGLPLDKCFRGAEVAVFRSEWGNPKALFLGFKAGDNQANHSHLDLGSFVFDALGARWAMDLGADNYNLPGYFGGQRWQYYRLRAEGHNTLVLNPGPGPDQDPSAAARLIRFESKPAKAFAIADLTSAYHRSARKVCRGLALLARNQLVIQDEIQAAQPAEVWWFMHTPAGIAIEKDGRAATLEQAGVQLRAEILSPERAFFEVRDAQPLPGSPHPDRQAGNREIRKLAIHLAGVTDCRLAVRLVPLPPNEGLAPEPPRATALSDW
ncbi:MAG: heparinase II/III family protein [Limisphaerales bacterium]